MIDPACFGPRLLNADELQILHKFLAMSVMKKLPVTTVMDTRVLPAYDPLGFAKLNRENEFYNPGGFKTREWFLNSASLATANKADVDEHMSPVEFSQAGNNSMEEKWFNDLKANRANIRFGRLHKENEGTFILYHKDTFMIPRLFIKRRFAVFGELTALSKGRLRNAILVDTALFDGLLTSRIVQYLYLVMKAGKGFMEDEAEETSVFHERQMLAELIFHEDPFRITRLSTKNMLSSFRAYASSLSPTMGYYEWTINPKIRELSE